MPLTHAQKTGLEAAILAYLTTEGGRFARTVAAFKEEAQVGGGIRNDDDALVVSGPVLEKAWVHLQRTLSNPTATAALYDAIDAGDLAEVQLYVGVGVDVEAQRYGELERSPFFHAAVMNCLEMVQYFLGLGYDKEVGGRNGASILHAAAQEGHVTVVQYLVEQGADKDKARDDGVTPLLIAAHRGHVAVVQYLVEQGADKDKARDDGQTPFMSACYCGHVDMAEYLLDQGCDRDRANNIGWTALHFAAARDHINVAQVLFRSGVKLDARDNQGRTPADVATARGHHAFADAVRAEEIRRRDHGFKRDRSTIEGTEEHEAAKRPRVEEEAKQEEEVDESDDDDDDDDDEEA